MPTFNAGRSCLPAGGPQPWYREAQRVVSLPMPLPLPSRRRMLNGSGGILQHGRHSRSRRDHTMGKTAIPYVNGKRTRERNSFWRGGKHISSHGYIKILVGQGHHLSDSKGYAYEHRIVAEKLLSRKLLKGEIVHHRNGIATDNRPENLEVVPSMHHHKIHHRTTGMDRRLPGELNSYRKCACGCNATFPTYDKSGRPRSYVSGHNKRWQRSNLDGR